MFFLKISLRETTTLTSSSKASTSRLECTVLASSDLISFQTSQAAAFKAKPNQLPDCSRHVNAPNGSDSLYSNGWTKCFLTAFITRWFMSLHAVHDLGLGVSNFRQSKFLLNRLIDHTTQHAMFTRERTTPALTLEKPYGLIPLRVVINRDGKPRNSDIDRFGFYNQQPYIYESLLDYWRDHMNGMDDFRFSTASRSHPWSAPSRACLEWTLRTLESRDQALGHDAPELSQTELRL
jgi:hypothetical protein